MDLKETISGIIAEIEKKGDVKAVFGEPIKEGNVTIIPVASLNISGGGGGGQEGKTDEGAEPKMKGKGFGMGYRKKAAPVGYIKIANDEVEFVPIIDWQRLVPFAIPLLGIGALIMMKALHHKKCEKG